MLTKYKVNNDKVKTLHTIALNAASFNLKEYHICSHSFFVLLLFEWYGGLRHLNLN